ncbi:hypothetical protein I7I50_09144 [Histoplasma capsulatum G186AR]|uniref:Uncharacterized protein n=1 Tax=Ajellomyces capsulatus TaxID=5037 RepID=A0A8H7YRU8_AJECA|nr:hypothetical protein I7I52_06665 [Histoplasma capsulatum]QSS74102.1 hypothetical protein I7I50_09144 [Histoplasma capsulatum G186AR]
MEMGDPFLTIPEQFRYEWTVWPATAIPCTCTIHGGGNPSSCVTWRMETYFTYVCRMMTYIPAARASSPLI